MSGRDVLRGSPSLTRVRPCLLALLLLGGSNACTRSQSRTLLHPELPQEQIHSRLGIGLTELRGWSIVEAQVDGGQTVLVLRKTNAKPDHALILVATAPSAPDGSELAIQIRIDSQKRVPAKAHAAVMREVNAQHARNWAGTFFIDRSGALLGQWTLNLPDRALDLAFVLDAILRLNSSWTELQAALRSAKITLEPVG